MNKTLIIIKREYFSRVKKKSFIIMTLLGPLLMASIWVVPLYLANTTVEERIIQVMDETGIFAQQFANRENIKFLRISSDLETAKKNLDKDGKFSLLYIPATELSVPSTAFFYSTNQPSLEVTSYVKDVMRREIESLKLESSGIDPNIVRSIKSNVILNTIKIDESGKEEKSFIEVNMVLGIFSGILIYIFIFLFGSQVMRGVIEEKTNRIIEVIVSSVRPFQLMMGKIVGVGLVGLTQFLLWILLTLTIVTFFQLSVLDTTGLPNSQKLITTNDKILNPEQLQDFSNKMAQQDDLNVQIVEAISSIDYGLMIISFLFFFLGGYLLYASLFAAVGSAVDSEADTQQFMLPITIPLILAIVMSQIIINDPNGTVAFWFSVIPLTSPIIMMVRIPFGVPYEEIYLAAGLLVLGFLFTTWLAAKIYRTGILMYGKKVTYKELWKWLRYSR